MPDSASVSQHDLSTRSLSISTYAATDTMASGSAFVIAPPSTSQVAVGGVLVTFSATTLLAAGAIAVNKLRSHPHARPAILLLCVACMLGDVVNNILVLRSAGYMLTLAFSIMKLLCHFPASAFLYIALMYRIGLFIHSMRKKMMLMIWSYFIALVIYALLVTGMVYTLVNHVQFPEWAVVPVCYYPIAIITSCLYTLYLARHSGTHLDKHTSILVPLSTSFKALTLLSILLWVLFFYTQYGISPTAMHPVVKLCLQSLNTCLAVLGEVSFEFLFKFNTTRQHTLFSKSHLRNCEMSTLSQTPFTASSHGNSISSHDDFYEGQYAISSSKTTIIHHDASSDNFNKTNTISKTATMKLSGSDNTLYDELTSSNAITLPTITHSVTTWRNSSNNINPSNQNRPSLVSTHRAQTFPKLSTTSSIVTPATLTSDTYQHRIMQQQQLPGFFMFKDVPKLIYGSDDIDNPPSSSSQELNQSFVALFNESDPMYFPQTYWQSFSGPSRPRASTRSIRGNI